MEWDPWFCFFDLSIEAVIEHGKRHDICAVFLSVHDFPRRNKPLVADDLRDVHQGGPLLWAGLRGRLVTVPAIIVTV